MQRADLPKKLSGNIGLNRSAQRRREEGWPDSTEERSFFQARNFRLALRLRVLLLNLPFQTVSQHRWLSLNSEAVANRGIQVQGRSPSGERFESRHIRHTAAHVFEAALRKSFGVRNQTHG